MVSWCSHELWSGDKGEEYAGPFSEHFDQDLVKAAEYDMSSVGGEITSIVIITKDKDE